MSVMRNFLLAFSGLLLTAGAACAEEVSGAVEAVESAVNTATVTAVEHVGEEAAHHSSGGLPQFDVTSWPSQIFWLVVFFAFLYVVFSKKTIPAISATLQNRKNHIDTHIADAESITQKAKDIEAQVAQAMKNAAHKASEEMRHAEDEAKHHLSDALKSFRTRYDHGIKEAESRIEDATAEAMKDMEKIVAELAAEIAGKVAGLSTDASQAETVVRSLSGKNRKAA